MARVEQNPINENILKVWTFDLMRQKKRESASQRAREWEGGGVCGTLQIDLCARGVKAAADGCQFENFSISQKVGRRII